MWSDDSDDNQEHLAQEELRHFWRSEQQKTETELQKKLCLNQNRSYHSHGRGASSYRESSSTLFVGNLALDTCEVIVYILELIYSGDT